MKKVLFICNNIPHNKTAGGMLYDSIIRNYGIENFSIVSVSDKLKFNDFNQEYLNIPIKQFALRFSNENIFSKVVKRLPLIEPFYLILTKKLFKKRIIQFANEQNCEVILAPLRGEVLLLLNDVINATNLPIIAMVEDTVEREIDDHKVIYKMKKKEYYNLLPKIDRLAVAGESMQTYFKSEFNIDSTILRPSYSSYSKIPLKYIDNVLNIFFSGNIYANNEMNSFLNALPLLSLNNPELEINIFIASHRKINLKSKKINVVNLGWTSENKLIEYMEKCHVSYLPYKSEPQFMHSMKYAFPAKAGFYISNNLPVFFHGPSYSSFNTFLDKYQVGISCDSMDESIISNKLERFINEKSFYSSCQKECLSAFINEYNKDIFKNRVANLFDNI